MAAATGASTPEHGASEIAALGWALTLVALGLGSRHPALPALVILYVGDVLWGSFFFVLFAMGLPRARPLALWAWACAATELIEFSQLYRAPWIDGIRATRLGGLLLGHAFSWSDVLCVAVGASAAGLCAANGRRRLGRPGRRA